MAILPGFYHLGVAYGVLLAFVSLCAYLLCLAVYRLYFHPLAKFPGPKIAALSVWYEFYFDAIKRGQYTFEIGRMHEKYGPIVRISPDELHVNDPDFIDELYVAGGKRRDKYEYFSSQFGIPESVFGTVSHDLHRMRRGALNRYFSKASVTKLEPIIKEAVGKMCTQIATHTNSGKPIMLSMAFSCMTTDIVTEYAFARSYNFLDSPTFEPNFHRAIIAGTDMGPYIKQFPWIFPLMQSLPDSVVMKLNPEMDVYLKFQRDIQAQIREIKEGEVDAPKTGRTQTTIFHELLKGDLPEREKNVERLWQEGQIIIGAGTETTAWTLSVTMFYILQNKSILAKLREELIRAIPDQNDMPTCSSLEQLPAVILEGLRLSYGVSTRLQRVSPDLPLHFNSKGFEYEIPAGTPVGMTSVLVHLNPELFPDPLRFSPDRWLENRKLNRYILSFSKGSRQCIGINLAYAELYMGIAGVVRCLGTDLELFETTNEDVEILHDCFVPTPKADTQGIRVLVRDQKHEEDRQ